MTEPNDNVDAGSQKPQKAKRVFTMLENNPAVMNELTHRIGVSPALQFYDVYSLYDDDMMALVPRPVYALLATIPMSAAWRRNRDAEDAPLPWYGGAGPGEPVFWLQQTVVHGCGLIGLLHCVANGVPPASIAPGSDLARFLEEAVPLGMDGRAELLNDSAALYEASEAVAHKGDTQAVGPDEPNSNHFVALVKARDGRLWELEGARKGPLDRGLLGEDEDAFSDRALELGIRRLVQIQREAGDDLPFSCIALAPSME
ncbi:putative ubiquitin C-terminal hydrolase L3 [Rosellinia necatrix]|uniref:Ubiquitin carboxyl-terminal hydrolase n=1 Tax=Rosellinia necatrix TaxID=77044 RepID=A0A1W2TVT0_ROSNE|nr:putative ubiquitin C-terminal hydrolase L3 [Rosellinia necatrix]